MTDSAALPLAGLKIIELHAIGPVPFAGQLLRSLGADVLRVSPPVDPGLGVGVGPEYDLLNLGKRALAVDLKHADGVALVADLVVQGALTLGQDAILVGNVKVHGDARLLVGAALDGALFAQGSVHCHGRNRLSGPLAAGRCVWLGADSVVGNAHAAGSVSAWEVRLEHDVTVFGRITCVETGEAL